MHKMIVMRERPSSPSNEVLEELEETALHGWPGRSHRLNLHGTHDFPVAQFGEFGIVM